MNNIKFSKEWSMPNGMTFKIKPIELLLNRYVTNDLKGAAPFANANSPATITNDLDTTKNTNYHMDALDFLKSIEDNSLDYVLYDPPYSPRQVSECYKKLGKTVNMQTTQSSFWGNIKKEIARVVKKDGFVISFGWNSGGIGKKLGFEQKEIMLVSHGGNHNDTIVTGEFKIKAIQ